MRCDDPLNKSAVHEVEAFGPVSTLMAYENTDDAITLLRKGGGSLVASVFSYDRDFTRDLVLGGAAFHGRMLLADRDSAGESTGHGSPLPHLVHGGPGTCGRRRGNGRHSRCHALYAAHCYSRQSRRHCQYYRRMVTKLRQKPKPPNIHLGAPIISEVSGKLCTQSHVKLRSKKSNFLPILRVINFTPI